MKKGLFCGVVLVALLWWLYDGLVDNMHISDLYLDTWPEGRETPAPNQLQAIMQQPFTYIGKGRQFFVFESADKRWVLKFIKCQRLQEWHEGLFGFGWISALRRERLQEKHEKINRLFESLALASGPLSDLTCVSYAHLEKKPVLHRPVTLIDALGMHHKMMVDEVPFVLQRKAMQVYPLFRDAGPEVRKVRFQQLVELFQDLADRGVIDIDDGAIDRGNVGFLEDRAIFIDIGTFRKAPDAKARLERDLKRLEPLRSML